MPSLSVLNINIGEVHKEGNTGNIKGIKTTISNEIKTLPFAEDQVITTESETLPQN